METIVGAVEVAVIPFNNLIDRYQYYLLDAYGVFWGSGAFGMLPGTREAMERLVARGKKVGILSNSTQLASKEKEKLAKHGVLEGVHYHFLLTSGEVTREIFLNESLPFPTPKKTYCIFGAEHARFTSHEVLFEGTPYRQTKNLNDADFMYIPVPHVEGSDQENPEAFRQDVQAAAQIGIPILCANPDHFAHEGSPLRLVVRQGMIAHMLKEQGASVYFIGKPFPIVYEKALRLFPAEVQPEEILMIGDTPETDIRGARQMGMATALVTKTGMMKERIGEKRASSVLGELPQSDQPDYAIESFTLPISFDMHPNFSSKIFLLDLPLCRVMLENERHYPWLMLIPRRQNVSRIMDLSPEDQLQLLQELDLAQKVLWNEFLPAQLNVGAIGNKTPQLHIHVIARFENDPAWPGTVWDHPMREAYPTEQIGEMQRVLQKALQSDNAIRF